MQDVRARPQVPVEVLKRPLQRFMAVEASSGIVLLICTALALTLANSGSADLYHAVLHLPLRIDVGGFVLDWTLHHWINDGLMTIFFFVVGLEIKREFVAGELRDPRKAALPVAAAAGGMIVPAAIYLSLQLGEPGEHGWGIPMATDIAFVVGTMAVLGPRVPHGLKIMVLALAIVDDIGAIIVIAVGYSGAVNGAALAAAAFGFGLCTLLNRVGVRAIWAYLVVGAGIWLAFVLSGVHPTVAGVALGLLTPSNQLVPDPSFMAHVDRVVARLRTDLELGERRALLMILADEARETVPPLERLENLLHPWVAFGIMPLFALANAGVHVDLAELGHPVENAVMLGLVVGKPIGILVFSYVFVRLGIARLPAGVNWPILLGGGFLGGIGFTMALFIADLALTGPLLDASKIGILTGSTLAAVAGSVLLIMVLPRRAPVVDRTATAQPTGDGTGGQT